ncbi:MAG: hypothetical protein C0482_27340 [Gordonia sp.]|nr:hypothetical protein [Gordonia sp. (in: high G+C Gram-positive bacteria)]OZG28423.1 hypothetical protein BH683_013565 [Williamsia sp. 1138]
MTSASADFEAIPLGCGRCGTQIPSALARCPECGQQMFVSPGAGMPESPREFLGANRVPASMGARTAAYLIDTALVIGSVAGVLCVELALGLGMAVVFALAVPLLALTGSALLRAGGRRTPGQVLSRTTVRRRVSGGPAGFWRQLSRTAALHVSNVLLFAGAWSVLADGGRPRRGWHEKISGTTTTGSLGTAGYEVVPVPPRFAGGDEADELPTDLIDPRLSARTLPLQSGHRPLRLRMDDGSFTDLTGSGFLGVPAVAWSGGRAEIVAVSAESALVGDTHLQFSVSGGKLWMISTGPAVGSVLDNGESVTTMRPGHPYEVGPGTVVHFGQRSFEVAG